jgi:hypothetical protein
MTGVPANRKNSIPGSSLTCARRGEFPKLLFLLSVPVQGAPLEVATRHPLVRALAGALEPSTGAVPALRLLCDLDAAYACQKVGRSGGGAVLA